MASKPAHSRTSAWCLLQAADVNRSDAMNEGRQRIVDRNVHDNTITLPASATHCLQSDE